MGSSARLLLWLRFCLAGQNYEPGILGERQGFEVEVEAIALGVFSERADLGPEGVVLLAFHHEEGVARTVGFLCGHFGVSRWLSGCANRGRSGDRCARA